MVVYVTVAWHHVNLVLFDPEVFHRIHSDVINLTNARSICRRSSESHHRPALSSCPRVVVNDWPHVVTNSWPRQSQRTRKVGETPAAFISTTRPLYPRTLGHLSSGGLRSKRMLTYLAATMLSAEKYQLIGPAFAATHRPNPITAPSVLTYLWDVKETSVGRRPRWARQSKYLRPLVLLLKTAHDRE